MQYLLQIFHLSCQVQHLPGYQVPWRVLLRNRMAECFASVSEDELCRLIEEKDSKNTKRATLFRQRFYYCILKFLNDLG